MTESLIEAQASITNESHLVPPLPSEAKSDPKDILQVYTLDNFVKSLLPLNSALSAMSNKAGFNSEDSPLTADYQAAYQRADTLRKASMRHSWTRATVMTVARSAVGSGFSMTRHPIYGLTDDEPDKTGVRGNFKELKEVYDFFFGQNKEEIEFIQDLYSNASKIMYTIASLVFYGQAAWEIIFDEEGKPIGFDVLPGFVFPNVSSKGKFKRPAYYYRPWNTEKVIEFRNPKKIVYFTWPGTDFSIFGSSEYVAAAESAIPSDIYASAVYRAHFENVNAPFNGYWVVNKETSEEDFKRFMALVFNRYTGARNFGRNPIVIRGDAEFKEMRSRANDDAPYLEGRKQNQEEISALSGVSSSKLGLGSNVNRTNFREQRRDFWETALRPLYAVIEETIYKQVFVRLFKKPEWMLAFNRPDLSTALEDATIYTRYIQNGVMNANEVRFNLHMSPRPDEDGNKFFDPMQAKNQPGVGENQGDTAKRKPGDRANEGESDRSGDMQRPPTSDRPQSDEPSPNKSLFIDEMRTWKKFALKVVGGKRTKRDFESYLVDEDTEKEINTFVNGGATLDEIRQFFDDIIDSLESN